MNGVGCLGVPQLLQSGISKPCCDQSTVHADVHIPCIPFSAQERWISCNKHHPEEVLYKLRVNLVDDLGFQAYGLNFVLEAVPVLIIPMVEVSLQGKKTGIYSATQISSISAFLDPCLRLTVGRSNLAYLYCNISLERVLSPPIMG